MPCSISNCCRDAELHVQTKIVSVFFAIRNYRIASRCSSGLPGRPPPLLVVSFRYAGLLFIIAPRGRPRHRVGCGRSLSSTSLGTGENSVLNRKIRDARWGKSERHRSRRGDNESKSLLISRKCDKRGTRPGPIRRCIHPNSLGVQLVLYFNRGVFVFSAKHRRSSG